MATLRTCPRSTLPPHNGKGHVLRGRGPLFDLPALQALLGSGQLNLGDDQQCWVATESCLDHLEKLQWTPGNQVKKLLLALRPGDFRNSQWCEDADGGMYDCDSYSVRVDECNDFRRSPRGLEYYIKFSLDESGSLYLVLIQCHLSRHRERT